MTGLNNQRPPTMGIQGLFPGAYSEIMNRPTTYYPGQTYANFAPETEQALQATAARASSGSPLAGAAQQTMLDTLNGNFLAQGNPYMQGMMDRFSDQITSAVGDQFAGAGRTIGSPAETQTWTREIANAMAPYAFNQYGQERGFMQQAAGMAPELSGLDYADLSMLRGVGSEREALAQRGIDEAVARHDYTQQEPFQRYQQMANILLGGGALGSTQKQSTPGAGPLEYAGMGMEGLGALGSTAALLSIAFSDRRLKRDIEQIGELPSGLPWYRFRYVWGDDMREGVMADEAERVFPDAVVTIGGYKAVNYGAIG